MGQVCSGAALSRLMVPLASSVGSFNGRGDILVGFANQWYASRSSLDDLATSWMSKRISWTAWWAAYKASG